MSRVPRSPVTVAVDSMGCWLLGQNWSGGLRPENVPVYEAAKGFAPVPTDDEELADEALSEETDCDDAGDDESVDARSHAMSSMWSARAPFPEQLDELDAAVVFVEESALCAMAAKTAIAPTTRIAMA